MATDYGSEIVSYLALPIYQKSELSELSAWGLWVEAKVLGKLLLFLEFSQAHLVVDRSQLLAIVGMGSSLSCWILPYITALCFKSLISLNIHRNTLGYPCSSL